MRTVHSAQVPFAAFVVSIKTARLHLVGSHLAGGKNPKTYCNSG